MMHVYTQTETQTPHNDDVAYVSIVWMLSAMKKIPFKENGTDRTRTVWPRKDTQIRFDSFLVPNVMHRKFRLLFLEKASSRSTALPSFFPCVQCFSCFHNPPNSDIDYRIFNMRMWSFLCVHIHTGGLGTLTASLHNILTRKNSHKFFLCLGQGVNLWSYDLESMLYQLSHPVTPSPIRKRSITQKTEVSSNVCRA